jgi:hypothetical protein
MTPDTTDRQPNRRRTEARPGPRRADERETSRVRLLPRPDEETGAPLVPEMPRSEEPGEDQYRPQPFERALLEGSE